MILESLAEMARRDHLVDEPAFQSVPVRWIVAIDRKGHFQHLDDTAYMPPAAGKRKPKVQYKQRNIPRRSVRTSGDRAEFLVDKSDYVLGVLPEEPDENARSIERRSLFLKELTDASSVISHEALNAVIAFLQNDEQRRLCVEKLREEQFASNDLFTFRVTDVMLDELPELRGYWSRRVANESENQAVAQCLLCGRRKSIVDKHDSIKLPGAVTSGVALVSFNSDAFEKHGLSRNENAPICRDCMVAYVNALRRCLERRYPRPDGDGAFSPQSLRLTSDTTAVYWDDQSSDISSRLWALDSEDPSDVKAALESPWQGQRPAAPSARFYCLLLTGVQGRVSLRGMHTSTLGEIVKNLRGTSTGPGYFTCLEACGYTDRPAPISVLVRSLAVQGKLESLPPGLGAEIFLTAAFGRPLSHWFLAAAVGRIRAERDLPRPRAALLHLFFQRHPNPELRKTPMSLDADSLDPAYRYGRLLAVLERLQIRALKRTPNSTIVDRYYAAASTRPATAFPRLLSLAQYHLRSVENPVFFSKEIEEILSGLEGAKGFRATLNLEEQGRFALGYFHQKNARFKGAPIPSGETNETESVPEESKE